MNGPLVLITASATVVVVAGVSVRIGQMFSRHQGRHVRSGKGATTGAEVTVVDLPAIGPDVEWIDSLSKGVSSRPVRRLKKVMSRKGWTSVASKPTMRRSRKREQRRRHVASD